MKDNQLFKVLLLALCIATMSRCNVDQINFDNIEIPNYQGDVGFILGTAAYTMSDLIEELQDSSLAIEEDNSKLLVVIYRDTIVFDDVDELIVIDDFSDNGILAPNINIPASPVALEENFTEDLQLTYPIADGEELDSIVYNAGSITLDIQSGFDVTVNYEFKIHDIKDRSNEDSLTFVGSIGPSGSDSQTISLINFRTETERVGNDNIFTGAFEGKLIINVGDVVLPSQTFDYQISFTGVGFETIYGYFGEKDFDIQDQSIEISFFEGIDVGGFSFKDPEINITIDNFIGVPLGLDLSGISSANDQGQTAELMGTITDSRRFVRAPDVNSAGQSFRSIIPINSSNSNLDDLLNISPNLININVSALTNFNYESSDENRNFVSDDGKADIFMDLKMPLNVKLQGFSRNFDFEFEPFEEVEDADTIHLLVRSLNYMPLNGLVDLQLIDASETVLYEFQDILLIKSPELGTSGRTETPAETLADVKMFGESKEAFLNTTRLNLIMSIDSYEAENDNYVKIFSDYQIDLKVSVRANLNKEF